VQNGEHDFAAVETLMRTLPFNTAIMLSPSDPIKKMVSPAPKRRNRARDNGASLSTATISRNSTQFPNDQRKLSKDVRSTAAMAKFPVTTHQSAEARGFIVGILVAGCFICQSVLSIVRPRCRGS
jgi:hypothetical protein